MNKLIAMLMAGGMALAAPAQANAAVFLFELTGTDTATFTLDDTGADAFDASRIDFLDRDLQVNGAAVTGSVLFYIDSQDGGFDLLLPGGDLTLFGPQLFSGPTSAPNFLAGTFALDGGSQISISQVSAAVPEPSTWALMLLGFGAVGASMRGSRKAALAKVTYA